MYKVIVVDDEHRARVTVRTIIKSMNGLFQVVAESSDGAETLAVIAEHKPDVIITDIRMPVVDGLQLIQQVRESDNRCDIVIISGYSDFEYAQRAVRFGVTEYLLKPIDPSELKAALERIREKSQQMLLDRVKYGDWILLCQQRAELMAELVWYLKEKDIDNELISFSEDLLEAETEPRIMQEKCVHYLNRVESNINRIAGETLFTVSMRAFDVQDMEQAVRALRDNLNQVLGTVRQSRNWGYTKLIQEAISFIDTHYSEINFSLMQVAQEYGHAPAYFSFIYKNVTGETFIQYVTRKRMERAMELLNDPLSKVYEVGRAVGYEDYSHFTKTFKKFYHFTPSEYRRRMSINRFN